MATVSNVPKDLPKTYYLAIGEVIGRWALFEWRLLHVFELLMGMTPKRARVVGIGMGARAKIQIVKMCAQNWCPNKEAKKELLAIYKEALKLAERRNDVAHGVWGSPPKKRIGIIHMRAANHRILPHREKLSAKDVTAIAGQIRDLQNRFDAVTDLLIAEQTPSPDK